MSGFVAKIKEWKNDEMQCFAEGLFTFKLLEKGEKNTREMEREQTALILAGLISVHNTI